MNKNRGVRQLLFDGSVRRKLLNAECIGFPFVPFFPGCPVLKRNVSVPRELFFEMTKCLAF
jgi:hypothetical protein